MRYPGDNGGSGSGARRGSSRGPDFTDYVLITLGGILLAISTFLPWITVTGVGSDNLFSWVDGQDPFHLLPWVMVAAGAFLAFGAYRRAPITNLALGGAVTAVVTIIVGGVDVYYIARDVSRAHYFDASIGVGIPSAAVAVFLLAVAAIRVQMRSRMLGSGSRSGADGRGSGAGGWGSGAGAYGASGRGWSGRGWSARGWLGRGSSGRGSSGGRRRWPWGGPRLRSVPEPGSGSGSGFGRFGAGLRRNRPEKRKLITEEAPFDRSPGWKPDPWGVGNSQRYWDGSSWTGQTHYRP